MKIQITIQGPTGCGKGKILADLKRYLEGDYWDTQETIEEHIYAQPAYSFIAIKEN